ncbi:TPA: cation transporter [Acinetobacter baumannii]|uniref:cation transporter n=1 Tax=Acinetobacter calcoaceticus/baumannii complex TaxID=909768 RepID=UPI00044DA2B7|nr:MULTISPECIES: cation diffusion facilitator family transporter [Acinetobacter calcoaceticus/baumannii complex]EHU2953344.1 cation transporter [Acinetobacter baumannii]EXS34099.1 cation efflux family protein [Acinetobacter sp. 826659]MBD0078939.1 cation transporter [Acinetobacter baumannii]MBP4674433.1 cation transporter [Acinetobacter baumannii]MBP5036086.1 cation transporter [Acinetobacter baumannii]
MSGCGCNKGSSCDDTKQNQPESEIDSCKGKDSATEENKSSCCGNKVEKVPNYDEKDSYGSNQPCSGELNSCCGPDSLKSPELVNGDKPIATFISDYNIPKMDCSAEEQMVRMTLSSLVDVKRLVFDLPNRNLKVLHNGESKEITAKLEALGFGAKLNKTEFYENKEHAQEASTFLIPKMDCSAEEQMVRMALSPLHEVKGLSFDLAQRKLVVFHTNGINEITTKLEALGFGAKIVETVKATGELPETLDPNNQAKVLKLLLAINGVLFLIEFISGIIAASTGLIADSLDMFADAAVYGIALYAVGKASKYQLKAAHFAGWIQLLLALIVIVDVVRRFMFGSEPESDLMILIGFLALIANVSCLYLISGHKDGGAHMKASWIFSANDVIVNMGVILAGVLVAWTGSAYPDLIIGILVSLFVLNGARKILALR